MKKEIDLSTFIDPRVSALVGRDNGLILLNKMLKSKINFEELEREFPRIVFKVPPRIVTINKSFFLGAFEQRAIALGEKGFLDKYEFETSEHIRDKIAKHVKVATLKTSQHEILNG